MADLDCSGSDEPHELDLRAPPVRGVALQMGKVELARVEVRRCGWIEPHAPRTREMGRLGLLWC